MTFPNIFRNASSPPPSEPPSSPPEPSCPWPEPPLRGRPADNSPTDRRRCRHRGQAVALGDERAAALELWAEELRTARGDAAPEARPAAAPADNAAAPAGQVTQETRAGDTLARLGGDEFVVLLSSMADAARAMQVAELDYIASSVAAQTTIAENYVGLPV